MTTTTTTALRALAAEKGWTEIQSPGGLHFVRGEASVSVMHDSRGRILQFATAPAPTQVTHHRGAQKADWVAWELAR